jgi:hypothetical protein
MESGNGAPILGWPLQRRVSGRLRLIPVEITRIEQWLWYLNVAGNVAMLLALLGRKLAGVYRVLFLYFTVDLLQSLLVLGWPAFIAQVYATTQPLKWILSFWFVLELYGRVLAPQAALAKFARGTVGALLAVSTGISLASIFVGHPKSLEWDWAATAFNRVDRTIDSTNAILLLLMSAFLLWFPVKVSRNAASYMTGFIFYFFTRWAELLAADLWPQYTRGLSAANLGVAFACMAFWVVVLRPEGETAVTVTGHRWNLAEAESLTLQLDAMNSRLARLMRS